MQVQMKINGSAISLNDDVNLTLTPDTPDDGRDNESISIVQLAELGRVEGGLEGDWVSGGEATRSNMHVVNVVRCSGSSARAWSLKGTPDNASNLLTNPTSRAIFLWNANWSTRIIPLKGDFRFYLFPSLPPSRYNFSVGGYLLCSFLAPSPHVPIDISSASAPQI